MIIQSISIELYMYLKESTVFDLPEIRLAILIERTRRRMQP